MLTPDTALTKLMDGNKRFAAFKAKHPNATSERLVEVAAGQHPFCAILSCVDSRVPPELVFDTGLGDLFVARVAAGIADDSAVGSTEFGVEEFHIPLVMVLGHERCGAVKATIDAVNANNLTAPGSIGAVVGPIVPAVKAVKDKGGDVLDNSVRESVKISVAALKASPILSKEIAAGKVKVVGARYDLDAGTVEIIA